MKRLGLGLLAVLVIGVLIGYGVSWYFQQPEQPAEEIRMMIEEKLPERDVQLYFAAVEGTHLVPRRATLPGCADDRECLRALLEQLIAGPEGEALPVLPEQTRIQNVEIENDLLRVDFSRELVDLHPGGSLSELLSIYSLVNSLTENFPYIRQLQVLVDGEVKETLKGHVRIDQPIYADFTWSQPPGRGTAEDSAEELTIEQLIEQRSN